MENLSSLFEDKRKTKKVELENEKEKDELYRQIGVKSRWNLTGSKKNTVLSHKEKASFINFSNSEISISRQCELLGLSRSSLYYEPKINLKDLELKQLIDEQYTKTPFYGSRKIKVSLNKLGCEISRKKIQRLMKEMGIEAVYPKPKTSKPNPEHKIYSFTKRYRDSDLIKFGLPTLPILD